ncbi:hypothetical protein OTU49_008922, partial [Cherax quadricarinatus]
NVVDTYSPKMNFQVLACVLGTVGLAAAVPVPSTPQQVPSVNDNALDSEVLLEVAALTSKFLPALREAFNNEEGTQMGRINRISQSFLPLARAVVKYRSDTEDNYNVDSSQKQQEAAEAVVPVLLDLVKLLVEIMPQVPQQTNFNVQDLKLPTIDSEFVPDQTIPEVKIPATKFVPEIVIPEIKIQ